MNASLTHDVVAACKGCGHLEDLCETSTILTPQIRFALPAQQTIPVQQPTVVALPVPAMQRITPRSGEP